MLSQPGLSSTTARIPVDIRRFPWIRRLAADYAHDFGRVEDLFAGSPADPGAWRAAITRAQEHARQRESVAHVLHEQQRRRGAPPEALAASMELGGAATVAIVTGQQAGLFGGPLFTLLKALTAIRLAERVRAEYRVPAVPIFWIDAEDHDWEEVQSCGVLDGDLGYRSIALGDSAGAHNRPVARVLLDVSIERALAELASLLPASEFTPGLLATLREVYTVRRSMVEAFARWLESILGPRGLVVFDASDPAAKPLAADIFVREVSHPGETARLAAAAGAELRARGYHAQATPAEGSVALFHLNSGREPIRQQGGAFLVAGTASSRAELLERIRNTPSEFSPNVLLRPIVQDTLFPTACYVAGPNELGYLGQLRRVYEAFGLPMPLIQQRASATILDSNAMRFLARHDVPLEALRAQDESALNELLNTQLPASVESSFQAVVRAVDERVQALAAEVTHIDVTLEGATRSTLTRMQDDLKKLHNKMIQAAKRKDETLRRQFMHAQAQAFPGGVAQERGIGFVYFLNKYGPALVDRLIDELPLEMGTHWVVTV